MEWRIENVPKLVWNLSKLCSEKRGKSEYRLNIPLHSWLLHSADLFSLGHAAPPFSASLRTLLVLVLVPTPQFASHSLQSDQTSTSQSTGHSREMSDAVVFFERWAYLCNLLNCMLQLQSILDKSLHSAPVEQQSWSSSCFRRRNLHYIPLLPIC